MGKIVQSYELLHQLGQGGMGVVYKARHIHFEEIYAIKRLWEQYSKNPIFVKGFLEEGKKLRKLDH
jgi:serine/threonine protein kinase